MKEEEKSIREEEKSRWNSSSSLGTNSDKAKEDTYEAPVSSSSSSLSGNTTKSEWGVCRTEAWQCFSSNMEVRFLITSSVERFCLPVTSFLCQVHRIHL